MAGITSTHTRSGRTQSHSLLKAGKHVAFLYEHVGLSLPHVRVQEKEKEKDQEK